MHKAIDSAPLARSGLALRVTLTLAVFLGIGALWRLGPLGRYLDAQHLAALGGALRARPDAGALVLGTYLVGALLFFPMTLLLTATALVFEPLRALAFGLGGAMAAAIMTY